MFNKAKYLAHIKSLVEDIKDMHSISDKEGGLLYRLAKDCGPDNVIVEIGSWRGVSTIWLGIGSALGYNTKIYAVDPHTGAKVHRDLYGDVNTYDDFISNIRLAGLIDIVNPLVMTSEKAVNQWYGKPVGLLWIDGDHLLVKQDYEQWMPYLVDGGVIALHDTTTWDTPRDVAMGIYKNGHFKDINRTGSITYAVRSYQLSNRDILLNRYSLYKRYIYQLLLPVKNSVWELLGLGLTVMGYLKRAIKATPCKKPLL